MREPADTTWPPKPAMHPHTRAPPQCARIHFQAQFRQRPIPATCGAAPPEPRAQVREGARKIVESVDWVRGRVTPAVGISKF